MDICCIGAGYVGGPTMAMIAYKCPHVNVYVVDQDQERVCQWNSPQLPIFEPGLKEIVQEVRGVNLFFSNDIDEGIRRAQLIFICVHTPTKRYGVGAGKAPDMRYIEACTRHIASIAQGNKIIVEKSTVPVRTAESIRQILKSNTNECEFEVLSNPEFLAEGSAVRDLEVPSRVLIGCEQNEKGYKAAELLAQIYMNWVPKEKIFTTNVWSAELSKLAANAFLAQRVSSINAISSLCEVTGADVAEVAKSIGKDERVGKHFLNASVGFGGSCFQKDILNLVYLCEYYGLVEVAEYWQQVVSINDWQKKRFSKQIVEALFGSLADKKIGVLGFAFKGDTNDTRNSPAIDVCKKLLEEKASLFIYDPKVPAYEIEKALEPQKSVTCVQTPYEAAEAAHAIVILTDWQGFKKIDYSLMYANMKKPAFIFDGRNILEIEAMTEIGFRYFSVGRTAVLQGQQSTQVSCNKNEASIYSYSG